MNNLTVDFTILGILTISYNHLSYQLVPESTEGESTLANDEQEWTLFEVGLAGNSDSFDFYIMDATMIWRPSALPFGVLITRG